MSKRLRTTDENDYITDLPNALISDILSRLPTKDAVKTSVLSRNWKCKWTSIYNIEIGDCFADASLASVVTRLLLCTQTSWLRSFVLFVRGDPCQSCLLETWISNVLRRNVQYLEIVARGNQRLDDSLWCFSGWASLTKFVLVMSCTLRVPADNCFPNLKSLLLGGGEHGVIKVLTTKVPGTGHVVLIFPILEILQLIHCEFLDINSVEIQAPKLILFNVFSKGELNNYEIKISSPKLVIFDLIEPGPLNNYVPSASPTVTYASLYNWHDDETSALRAHNILTKFSNLKCLRIHGKVLKALLHLKPGHVFPTFNLLKELEINFYYAFKDVLELLQLLPPLESLIIRVHTLVGYEFGEALSPKMVSKLKEVRLLNFSAAKGQYLLATYLLENAKNLSKMPINLQNGASNVPEMTDEDEKPVHIVIQSLSKLKPKGSSCEIVVVEQERPDVWAGSIPLVICGNGKKYHDTSIVSFK